MNKVDIYFYEELYKLDKNIADKYLINLCINKKTLKKSISFDNLPIMFDKSLMKNVIKKSISLENLEKRVYVMSI